MKVGQVCTVLVLSLVLGCSPTRDVPVRRFGVNLDLPPEQRFLPIYQDQHIQQLIPMWKKDVENIVKPNVPKEALSLIELVAADLDRFVPQPFAAEMRGIANCTGLDLGDLVMLNLFYDLTAFCISIVAQDSQGTIWHGRNLDFDFGDILRNFTIIVDFQTKGQTLYTGTTFLGHIGMFTGQRPNNFTLTSNEREIPDPKDGTEVFVTEDTGSFWLNALELLLNREAVIQSFLMRETLEKADSYAAAVQKLRDTPLIAPVYFIIGGVNKGEGTVITRNQTHALDVYTLEPTQGRWYLLETNFDRWVQPPPGHDRRTPGQKAMNTTGQARINATTMYQEVLSVHPMLRNYTVYTTIMSAAQPQVYYAMVRWP